MNSRFQPSSNENLSFDLVVLGGGPAGACGAGTAAVFGRRVALVEKEPQVGGAGVNSGTVPSKTLRETALALSGWRSRKLFGVDLSLRREATVADFMRHQQQVSDGESKRIAARLQALAVDRFQGAASFLDANTVRVTGRDGSDLQLRGEKILIATGSSPFRPPAFPFEDDRVHDSDQLLHLAALPKRLAVIGAGAIGSEYACTFAAMGVQVHLVDGRDALLPFLDGEISRALAESMAAGGVRFHWNESVVRCDATHPGPSPITDHLCMLDAIANPGNSGGPVCDETATVVGVLTAGTKNHMNNYTLAVPATDLTEFVRPLIRDFAPADMPNVLKWPDIAELAGKSAILVLVEKATIEIHLGNKPEPDVKNARGPKVGALEDRWCIFSAGRSTVECPQGGCALGKVLVPHSRQIGRHPATGEAIIETTKRRRPCPTCRGRGVVDLPTMRQWRGKRAITPNAWLEVTFAGNLGAIGVSLFPRPIPSPIAIRDRL